MIFGNSGNFLSISAEFFKDSEIEYSGSLVSFNHFSKTGFEVFPNICIWI
jgi:hypothetical protein